MPQMAAASAAYHFRAHHAMTVVRFFDNPVGCGWLEITWPAASGVKLGIRTKEVEPAACTMVHAVHVVVVVGAGKRPFRTPLSENVILNGGQLPSPFIFGFADFVTGTHGYAF